MESIIKSLQSSISARDVKRGYRSGHYDLESCVIECLMILNIDGLEEDEHTKTESIMVFLHE